MTLSSYDLARIRQIVRDELESALGRRREVGQEDHDADKTLPTEVREMIGDLRRKSAERAARPISDGPFVDGYDAARLAGVMPGTVVGWVRQGLLTKHKVKNRLQIDRAELDNFIRSRRK